MENENQFYDHYDHLISHLCKPYRSFLELGACAIREANKNRGGRSICEVGMGTGNFSMEVRKLLPTLEVIGLDLHPQLLNIAKKKLGENTQVYAGDAFAKGLPPSDFYISSLMLHHFERTQQLQHLKTLGQSGLCFVNFDLALDQGKTKYDAIASVLDFARNYFQTGDLEKITQEMQLHDNPLFLEEHRELYKQHGMHLTILGRDDPFVVYSVQQM